MRTRTLAGAAHEIHDLCLQRDEAGRSSPFLLLVGAGVSNPPIPLAAEIVHHCVRVASRSGRPIPTPPPSGDALKTYSFWLEQAFPHSSQRQGYLESLINGECISRAVLRLAHLLLARDVGIAPIAEIVVTPNFDDLLSRALHLFGKHFAICDHPATTVRIDPERHDLIQIVHVHGTYREYDCTNLTHEVELAARGSEASVQTMAALLDRLFHVRTPIVCGYSGWERDVIMRSLRRRLDHRLGANLYWFCYRRIDADRLPSWLREHPDVRIVVPDLVIPIDDLDPQEGTGLSGSASVALWQARARLPALKVFETMLSIFGASAPSLTRDPLEFHAAQLESLIPWEDQVSGGGLYDWSGAIARLRAAGEAEGSGIWTQAIGMGQHSYAWSDPVDRDDPERGLNEECATQLLDTLFTADGQWQDRAQRSRIAQTIRRFQILMMERGGGLKVESLASPEPSDKNSCPGAPAAVFGPSWNRQLCVDWSRHRHGASLFEANKIEEALQVLDEIVSRPEEPDNVHTRKQILWAHYNKALIHTHTRDLDAAEASYLKAMQEIERLDDSSFARIEAHCQINRVALLVRRRRLLEARELALEAIELCGRLREPWARVQLELAYENLAWTWILEAKTHLRRGRREQAEHALMCAVEAGPRL